MTYELEYRLALRPYEYVNIRIESETAVTLSVDLDALKDRAREIFEAYDAFDLARQIQGEEAMGKAQSALQALGATVVEETPNSVMPSPEDPVQPLWERPPAPVAQPSGAVVDTSVDDFDF